jgi:type VI protein secretion system component VasF
MERHAWTDERIDDMADRLDANISHLREDLRALDAKVDARFNAHEARMDARFGGLRRDMFVMYGVFIAALVTLLAGRL